MTGLVYKSTGSWYTVKTEDNQQFDCRIKGKFRLKGIKSTNPIAVGDIVDFDLDETSDIATGLTRALVNSCKSKCSSVRAGVNTLQYVFEQKGLN